MKLNTTFKITTIIICALIIGTVSNYAHAGLFDIFNKKEAPKIARANPDYPRTEEEFEKNTEKYNEIPFNHPKYEFSIKIPKSWSAKAIITSRSKRNAFQNSLGKEIPYDIAKFKSPPLQTAQINVTIQAIDLEHEISVRNWLHRYVTINQYALTDDIKVSEDKRKARASIIHNVNGASTSTIIITERNKDIMMILRFDVPARISQYTLPTQQLIAKNFDISFKINEGVEKTKKMLMGDNVKISYPASWTEYRNNLKNFNEMFVELHSYTDTMQADSSRRRSFVNGMIKIHTIKRRKSTSLEKEIKKLTETITQELHINIDKLVSSQKADAYDRFLFSRYEEYETSDKQQARQGRDLHLAILGDEEWYIFAYLYTPDKTNDFYNWARNTESFKQIIRQIR